MTTPGDDRPDGWGQSSFSFAPPPEPAPQPPAGAPPSSVPPPAADEAIAPLSRPQPIEPAPSSAHYWWAALGVLGGVVGFLQLKDRALPMARRVLVLGIAATVVPILVAVLGTATSSPDVAPSAAVDPDPAATTEPRPETTYVAPTTSYTPPATTSQARATAAPGGGLTGSYSFVPRAVYQFDYTDEFGYTSQVRIGTGSVGKYGAQSYGADDPGTCGLDEQTDALVPFALESINTTPGFDQRVRYSIAPGAASAPSSGRPVERVIFYNDGPSCDTWAGAGSYDGASISGVSTNSLSDGQFSGSQGYFILRDYYTPATPDGDLAWAQSLTGTVGQYTYSADDGSSGTLTVTSCTGPGASLASNVYGSSCTLPLGSGL